MILSDIKVKDEDKPNTPNSKVQLSIVGGNEGREFEMTDPHRGTIKLNSTLDFDNNKTEYHLKIMAQVRFEKNGFVFYIS